MTLRKINILLLLAATYALLASSCTDDFFDEDGRGGLAPGTPVELTLGLSVPQPAAAVSNPSRANPTTEINRQIYDLFLFFFDEEEGATKGQLKSKFYFPSISSAQYTQCDPTLSSNGSALIERATLGSGHIRHLHTTAGRTRIVGLANVSVKGSANILQQLTQITTFDELQAIMVSTIDRQSGLPDIESELSVMSGYYCEDGSHSGADGYTPCIASADSHNGCVDIRSAALPGKVWLTPLQSKVRFVVDGNGTLGGKFELQSWQVYNLPGQTPLICPGSTVITDIRPTRSRLKTTIYPYEAPDGENLFGEEEIDADHVYAFAFFPADNHPGAPKNEIDSYAGRAVWTGWESQTGTVEPDSKTYANAPDNATYVVLRGHYSGKSLITDAADAEPTEKDVDADVTYTVFLGHNSATDFNDFNTYRNTNYTYVVRVKGVNQISVEVNTGHDRRPDAEGNISVVDSRTEVLDCHFEQRVITISKQQVLSAIANKTFRMIVDEPTLGVNHQSYRYFLMNADGDYQLDSDGNPIHGEDEESAEAFKYMQWVQFYRHADSETSRRYIPYTQPKSEDKLMNVREFMAHLLAFANDASVAPTDNAVFTVYFDEYVYLDEQGNQRHPVTGEEVTWDRLVSPTGYRAFSMMGSTSFSTDHNSSYSTAGTSFRQRQMQTIYNPGAGGLLRGWATECVEERIFAGDTEGKGGIPFGVYNSARDIPGGAVRYGRQNTWRVLTNGNNYTYCTVNNIIDQMTGYIIPQGNQCIYHECMSRNRDLNGNGVIDREEFRWYMPSIEQLNLLYVGRYALSPEVQLYNPEEERENFFYHPDKDGNGNHLTYMFKHYLSSSKRKLWAEEGSSESAPNFNNTSEGNYLQIMNFRCVRDLGTDNIRADGLLWNISNTSDPTAELARFQSVYDILTGDQLPEKRRHVYCRIKLEKLSTSATRTTSEQRERPGLIDTFSDTNKPVIDFEVADTLIGNVSFRTEIEHAEASPQLENRCSVLGQGWRMPTFTELLIMQWAVPDYVGNVGSRTRSYFHWAGIQQEAWFKLPGWFHIHFNGQFSLTDGNNTNLRCVRDYMASSELNDDENTDDTPSVSNKPARRAHRVRR